MHNLGELTRGSDAAPGSFDHFGHLISGVQRLIDLLNPEPFDNNIFLVGTFARNTCEDYKRDLFAVLYEQKARIS